MKDLKYEHQSTNMNTKFWGGGGGVDGGGVGVGGVVGYYNFPRSTNKIKSFDKILTPEKKKIFLCISLLGGRSNLILGTGMENQIFILRTPGLSSFFIKFSKIVTLV